MRATSEVSGSQRLAAGYKHALLAADVLFGGFVILMMGIAVVSYINGDAPIGDVMAVGAFLVVNVIFSEISRRINRPYQVETARLFIGGAITAGAYYVVSGPLAPWWPCFMVLALGGAIGFGLLTARARLGRLAVGFYLTLFVSLTFVRDAEIEVYSFVLEIGIIATIGLMFAEIMALLGRALQAEAAQSRELERARDALFAEMEVAREIQTLLLPKSPTIEDSLVEGRMLTASEVGGDYYDVIHAGSRTLLAVGDVSGHGVTSGLTMMMTRSALLGAVESSPEASLSDIYRILNRCVFDSLARMGLRLYMTFALLEYYGAGRYSVVGMHMPLLVYRHRTQEVEEIELNGAWLGVVRDLSSSQVPNQAVQLEIGDSLVLYTDGIIEAFNEEEMFGFDRLTEAVREYGPQGSQVLADQIVARVREFSERPDDDLTLMVISYDGVARSGIAAA
ncbi:MAG: SpoIIE family protein phosphatase [Myxococcota bacterium]